MKKPGLTLIVAAGMLMINQNVRAQVEEPQEVEQTEVVEKTKQENDDFIKLDVLALPQAIKDAIMTDMDGTYPEEAWVKEKDGKNIYKLVLNVNGEKKMAYIDKEGNWIEEEDK